MSIRERGRKDLECMLESHDNIVYLNVSRVKKKSKDMKELRDSKKVVMIRWLDRGQSFLELAN